MRLLDNLLERVGGWFGLEVNEPPANTLATAIAPYERRERIDPARAERATRIFESLRATCEHYHYAGVDDSPSTPEKVWECTACGWLFRIVTNPTKPWFIRELVQVDETVASHAVSGTTAVRAPTPPAAAVPDTHSHIDLSDAAQ